jgi:hypothetical protein
METEEAEPIDEADRAVCATRTYVTRQHRREIGQMTTPYLQAREKCGLVLLAQRHMHGMIADAERKNWRREKIKNIAQLTYGHTEYL